MRVLVSTVVHRPEDARIRHRQIPALLEAGHQVIYLAPPGDTSPGHDQLERVIGPTSSGRDRLRALRIVRPMLRDLSAKVDVTVLHDPELLALSRVIQSPAIWDVHEDLSAQLVDKAWVPRPLRPLSALASRFLLRRGMALPRTIAEVGYQATHHDAVLVRNTVIVPATAPPTGNERVVYVGRVSNGRGASTLTETARRCPDVHFDVLGPADADVTVSGTNLVAHGFVPNNEALTCIEGAIAGLSLLRDLPNYRHSMPTKILEYLAQGVPVISTPLPAAVDVIETHDCGIIVPFDDPASTAAAIEQLRNSPDERQRLADNGRRAVQAHFNWLDDAAAMIDFYGQVAAG